MIQIFNRDFDKLSKEHKTKILSDYSNIKTELNAKIGAASSGLEKTYKYLFDNIEKILIGEPSFVESDIIPTIDNYIGIDFFILKDSNGELINKSICEDIQKIFNYKIFSTFHTRKYDAYTLAEKLNINVCPYCNRQYINTLKPTATKGGTRPTLDHFYIKSKYPYLALSFWNLVPSCYSCNSQFRTTQEIGLHPYLNGFEGILQFYTEIDIDLCEYIDNKNKNFTIKLLQKFKSTPAPIDLTNAEKNKTVFRLEDLYNLSHKDYVKEIIQKAIIYNKKFSKDLFKTWPDIFNDENEAQRLILGNYIKKEDYEKRPLAKLTKDIAEELKLI